ncbi:MAG: gamma-glutamyltransferase [Rhodospirillales bacterium]|nr:gamma-glutamyltransferase [Rhodospirillales bacterium]
MKLFKFSAFSEGQAKPAHPRNQSRGRGAIKAALSAILAAAALSGCGWFGGSSGGTPGVIGSVRGFLGGATADEPRAALVARDILSAGGSAVDAAVAAAFTLTVTYPTQMPLGGGGACLVTSGTAKLRAIEMVSFPAVAARADSTVATPGIPRGLFALHARFGVLRWEQVMSPAESLARNGGQATRAFANDLVANWDVVARGDDSLRRLYSRGGQPVGEGVPLVHPDLAVVLGAIRQRGPGDLHSGQLGRMVVQAASAAGIDLRVDDLAAGAPQFGPSLRVGERFDLFVGATPAIGGIATGQIYGALEARWRATNPAERASLLASTGASASRARATFVGADLAPSRPLAEAMSSANLRALSGAGGAWAGEADTPGGTALAVVDRNGMAVACSFAGYSAFGIGRIPPGVGFLLAPAPDNAARSARWLTVAIGMRDRKEVVFAGAASGGAGAPLALSQVALDTLVAGRELGAALAADRVAPGTAAPASGGPTRVQAIVCLDGLLEAPSSCRIEAEPRGAGLGIGSQ